MARGSPFLLLAALAAALLLQQGVHTQMHTQVRVGRRGLGVTAARRRRPLRTPLARHSSPPAHFPRSSPPPTQVEILDDSCDAQLAALWGNYTSPPVAPVAGCDRDCLQACYHTLNWAIYSEKLQDCPTQDAIIACFHVSCCCCSGGAAAGRRGEVVATSTCRPPAHPPRPLAPPHTWNRSPTAPSGTSLWRSARCSSGACR